MSLNKILHKNNFNLKSFFLTSIKDKVAYFSHCKLNSGMQILWYRGYWQTSSYSESQIPALFLFIAPWHVRSRVPYMKLGLFSIILGVFVRILLTCDFKSKISLWVRWHNKESWSMIAMVSLFRWLFTHDNVKVRNICDKNTKEFFPARNKFEILKRWYGTVIGKELGSIHNSMIQFRSFGIGFWNAPFPCSGNRPPLVEFSIPM